MCASPALPILKELRERIQRLEGGAVRHRTVLPFGISAIDRHLLEGGLALGALHEVAGGGNGAVDAAAAALFTAGIAARTRGNVLSCVTHQDLFAPAIAQAGLLPDRVLYLEAGDETSVLACFEEGLRQGALGAVVAEVATLSITASRRLQLAAEGSGVIGIAIRRFRRQLEAADFGQPTAAVTRWRVSALPSTPLPVPDLGQVDRVASEYSRYWKTTQLFSSKTPADRRNEPYHFVTLPMEVDGDLRISPKTARSTTGAARPKASPRHYTYACEPSSHWGR